MRQLNSAPALPASHDAAGFGQSMMRIASSITNYKEYKDFHEFSISHHLISGIR
jgi:hypothetical protein